MREVYAVNISSDQASIVDKVCKSYDEAVTFIKSQLGEPLTVSQQENLIIFSNDFGLRAAVMATQVPEKERPKNETLEQVALAYSGPIEDGPENLMSYRGFKAGWNSAMLGILNTMDQNRADLLKQSPDKILDLLMAALVGMTGE